MRAQNWRANYYEAIRERNEAEALIARVRSLADEMEDQARGGHDEDDDAYRDAAERIRQALNLGEDAPDIWSGELPPGGWVCGECLQPTESEPCPEHQPNRHAEVDR